MSGKAYIGQTSNSLQERWRSHIKDAKRAGKSKSIFHHAISSYGPEAFVPEILCETDSQEELDRLECSMILSFKTQDRAFGYNVLDGGNQSPAKLPEVRARISATLTGKKRTQESIDKQIASRLSSGYKPSEETRRRLSESVKLAKANGMSEETRAKISAAAKLRTPESRKWSDTARANHIASLVGRIVSEETRRKISESEKGKFVPDEVRKRTSETMKLVRANKYWSTSKK